MANKFDYVYLNDWCGVYIDGELVHEGHEIETIELLKLLLRSGLIKADKSVNWEAWYDAPVETTRWRMPKQLSEIPGHEIGGEG